jgi:hypothetical protein
MTKWISGGLVRIGGVLKILGISSSGQQQHITKCSVHQKEWRDIIHLNHASLCLNSHQSDPQYLQRIFVLQLGCTLLLSQISSFETILES